MSNFFLKKRKVKSSEGKGSVAPKGGKNAKFQKLPEDNEEIESGSSEEGEGESEGEGGGAYADGPVDQDDEIEETAEQKKLRLAKQYIADIRDKLKANESDESGDSGENEKDEDDEVGFFLRKEAAIKAGLLHKNFALTVTSLEKKHQFRGHRGPVTCSCVSDCGKFLFTGGKDCSIIKWDLEKFCKIWLIKSGRKKKSPGEGHKGTVNALAVSYDTKFLASAATDCEIFIWNPVDASILKKLKGHKNSILGLKFRPNSYQLYSCSVDRFVKIWQVDDGTLLDNLCGHEGQISGIDTLSKDHPITCGGLDKSIRLWKVSESSQLIFMHNECIDCIAYLSDDMFLTGDNKGAVCLWTTKKKKPLFSETEAHAPEWVTSLAALPLSDFAASGSCNGLVKLWRIANNRLNLLHKIDQVGFVNSICFSFQQNFSYLIFTVSQEHRLGRWRRIPECENSTVVFELKTN